MFQHKIYHEVPLLFELFELSFPLRMTRKFSTGNEMSDLTTQEKEKTDNSRRKCFLESVIWMATREAFICKLKTQNHIITPVFSDDFVIFFFFGFLLYTSSKTIEISPYLGPAVSRKQKCFSNSTTS